MPGSRHYATTLGFNTGYRPSAVCLETEASAATTLMRADSSTVLACLNLLLVQLLPLLALFQDELFGVLKRSERALSLDDIARLAAGDEIVHSA